MNEDDDNDQKQGFDSAAPLDPLHPKNFKNESLNKANKKRKVAVAITGKSRGKDHNASTDSKSLAPSITASGYGYIAEQIMELAFQNDVRVREDSDLAELLAHLDQDSPIPVEAIEAIAEILSYVYQANGAPNPFDAILNRAMEEDETNLDTPDKLDKQ